MPTLLVAPEALVGGSVEVAGDAYRHLFRARRLAVGDPLRVVDGRGRARRGRVSAVGKRSATVELGNEAPTGDPPQRVELLVAALRKERASWLVEKATELGAAAVRFLATERTPREYGSGTFDRLGRVAAAALEQAGGARLPEVSGIHAREELPALLERSSERFFLHTEPLAPEGPSGSAEASDTPGSSGSSSTPPEASGTLAWSAGNRGDRSGAVLIGPEGGWSEEEVRALLALGCRPVHLGVRVLRVETAAVVAAASLLVPR